MRLSHSGLLVLKACLDRAPADLYGYELMQVTRLASGTLYPLLLRFEEAGWLRSTWEKVDPGKEGRPRRRMYRITTTGQGAIAKNLGALGLAVT